MPRFWLSGPRILGGLIRPGISFSSRELAAWGKKAPRGAPEAMLGLFRRDADGAIPLAIPDRNASEDATGFTPVAAFQFGRVDAAGEARTGALVRLVKHAGQDGLLSSLSVGQAVAAIRAEAAALGLEAAFYRIAVDHAGPETPPALKMSWADIVVASLLPALLVAVAAWVMG
jgi:hypothetical protein